MQILNVLNISNHRRKDAGCLSTLASLWPALVLLVVLAAPAHAQYRASIQGVVTDPNGALLPGATLTLKDMATNETVVRTSNESGIYNFNALPADHFTLTAEKQGFKKKILNDLQLIPEQPNALNIQLELGDVSESVSVNASLAPAMDTETANSGRTISEDEIQHMPSFQRNVIGVMQLVPGVVADGAQGGGGGGFNINGTSQTQASFGGGGNLGSSSSIFATESGAAANTNGQRFDSNGYTVDGISTASAAWGGATILTPSQDSIDNVRVISNAYDAENGRFAGAITEITSKSGTNNIHGSIFTQVVRPGLNAYQRWNGPAKVQRETDRYNQLGGSVGGPIWKSKIFAFFNYEGQKQNKMQPGSGWYTTTQLVALAPAGSIAKTYLNFPGAAVLGTLATATCHDAGLIAGTNCNNVTGQGINIGSPLTTGLSHQDLTYVDNSTPGVGNGLSTVADIALYDTNSPVSTDFKQ